MAAVLLSLGSMVMGKTHKAVFVIIDGIPAECVERLQPPTLMNIAHQGRYHRGYCGGEVGSYSETPTISAIGYTNILTGTWVNKHNVRGNDNIKANYHYPTLFRIAKDQQRPVTTAIFSSWTDNRTILLGEGLEETRHLKVDYIFDGYEHDTQRFPHRDGDLHIRDIDGQVCQDAAQCISQQAPDLSWIYLWYTDDAYHNHGSGAFTDEAVMNVDRQLLPVWEAIQKRERDHDEEWLLIVTTDHGRDAWGKGHGGHSPTERAIWIITNQRHLNRQFSRPTLSHVDISPTICRWMDFSVPQDVEFERDGISFIGNTDIYDLTATGYDNTATLTWRHSGARSTLATIYIATTNDYAIGKSDVWTPVTTLPAREGRLNIDLSRYPKSDFYKFVVRTPSTTLSRWLQRK